MMNKRLFSKEFRLLSQNLAFIIVIILMAAVVIFGICQMFKFAATSVAGINEFMQKIDVTASEPVNNSNLDKEISEVYQLLRPEYLLNNILSVASVILPILFVIIAAVLTGEEFSNRTAPIKAAYFGWQRVTVTKTVLLAVMVLLAIGFLLAVGAVAGIINWRQISDLPQVKMSTQAALTGYSVIKQLLTVFLMTMFYALLAELTTLLTRKTFLGCTIPILLMYIAGTYINFDYLPKNLGSVLINKNFIFSSVSFLIPYKSSVNISDTGCYILLSAYILLLFGICFFYSGRQQIKQR